MATETATATRPRTSARRGRNSTTPAPAIALEVVPIINKGSVVVLVVANYPAPVRVTGLIGRLGESGRQHGVRRRAPLRALRFAAKLTGGTQSLASGRVGRFTLAFPKKLKAALTRLPPSQPLTLRIEATATNVAGQITASSSIVKL
jgi:hypothetical protein